MGYRWSPSDASMGEGFRRIAREQIDKAIDVAGASSMSTTNRVHEARRRCKRLRALLRLVRPDLPQYKLENAFIRDAARGLSSARDMRVIRLTLSDLLAWAHEPPPPDAPPAEDATADAELAILAAFAAEMRLLRARTETWSVDGIKTATLARGLKATYAAARSAAGKGERSRSDEALHEWRKDAKYHWHHLRLLASYAPDVMVSAHECAGELAELLGRHHDLAVLSDVLATDPEGIGAGVDLDRCREAGRRWQSELELRIFALGHQLFAERPPAVRQRFKTYLDNTAGLG